MFKPTDVFLCLGRRGCGKSYLARKISRAYPRRITFDTLGEYSHDDGVVVSDFESFSKAILDTKDSKEFSIIYQFSVETSDHGPEFNEALRVLFYRGNVLICVEEVQEFASTHKMPMWLRTCLLRGRHRNLGLLFTTQRPGECHKTIVSQSSHVFCGSLHEKNDVDYCRSVLGDHAFDLYSQPERQFTYFRPGMESPEVFSTEKTGSVVRDKEPMEDRDTVRPSVENPKTDSSKKNLTKTKEVPKS